MLFRSKSKAELDGSAPAAPSAGNGETAGEGSATPDAAVSSGGGPSASGSTNAREAQRLAVSAIRQSVAFAQIVSMLMRSPRYRHYTLGDLEWLVMPAILLKQFRIFYNGEQPVGVALWALADDLVAKRIEGGDTRLTAVEWKSGTHLRIVDIVAPFGAEGEMREQVRLVSKAGENA